MISLLRVISHMVEILFSYKEARRCARNDGMFVLFLAETIIPLRFNSLGIKDIPGSELPHKLRHLHSFPRSSRLLRVHRYRLLLTAQRERVCPSYVRLRLEREINNTHFQHVQMIEEY
jgi:hypothetical protein